ncbi:sensor histidine kinase [Pseudonocardia oroxyli]|uniref:histidine kinase n=1 Tax=Pseudonocardia oroxyli TaxID=366584 RepID=A0A1G7RVF7_PSEOR|nr:histidine kinase [Pseudonocardia oroxyli]SDG14807.1 Signal transduction histidine kinase [Pseudonocardia oroxyli]
MKPSRPVWAVAAGAFVAAYVTVSLMPLPAAELRLGPGVGPAMLAAGVAVLLVAASRPRGATRGVVPGVGLLGATTAAYPTVLMLGLVVGLLADGWHIFPLTLVQLVPVLARTRVVGNRDRRWETAILLLAVVGIGMVGLVLAGVPGAEVPSGVLWFGSFLLAPIATWRAVVGSGGETRRRAILAAVAAMIPVAIIVWCTALGFLAAGVGAGEDASLTALFLGFAVGALLCGLIATATTAPAGSPILRTRVVVLALHGVLGTLVLIVGSVAALLMPAIAAGWALLAGAAVAGLLTWPWLRLHGWLARVVDPSAELRHELSLVGDVGEGQHRRSVLVVLRRLVEDPDLTLAFRVAPGTWIGMEGTMRDLPGHVVLATTDGEPTVVALPGAPEGAARLDSLGDLAAILRPAAQEAALEYASGRAAAAAEDERRRIAQDLHDGLQGRLLGLALNLQLSGRGVDDPATRLLLEETVGTLRSAVEEVRALGGGRQPELLAREGLAVALGSLFRAARPVVSLDVTAARFPPEVETTAYYVAGEAVANALKHGSPSRVDVRVEFAAGALTVTVTDDGRGGADPRLGSGLRGLAERVAAGGGVLVVRDGVPTGTAVEAVVPCGS